MNENGNATFSVIDLVFKIRLISSSCDCHRLHIFNFEFVLANFFSKSFSFMCKVWTNIESVYKESATSDAMVYSSIFGNEQRMLLRNRTIWLDAKLKCILVLCTNFSFFVDFFLSFVSFAITHIHILLVLRIKFYYFWRSISGLWIALHWVLIIKFWNMNPKNIVHCICCSC